MAEPPLSKGASHSIWIDVVDEDKSLIADTFAGTVVAYWFNKEASLPSPITLYAVIFMFCIVDIDLISVNV